MLMCCVCWTGRAPATAKVNVQNHVAPVPALQHRPRRGPNCRCVVAIRRIDWTGIFPQAPSHTFASLKPKPHGLMVRCRPLITLHNPDTTGPASRYRKHVKEGGCDLCALDFFTLNSPTYPGTRSRLGSFKEQPAKGAVAFSSPRFRRFAFAPTRTSGFQIPDSIVRSRPPITCHGRLTNLRPSPTTHTSATPRSASVWSSDIHPSPRSHLSNTTAADSPVPPFHP